MNRSLAAMSRTSAGIMSPAESFTTSPGTSCLSGISFPCPRAPPSRVTLIIAFSFAAAAPPASPARSAAARRAPPSGPSPCRPPRLPWRRNRREHDEQDDQRIAHRGEQPPWPAAMLASATTFGPFRPSAGRLRLRSSPPAKFSSGQIPRPFPQRHVHEDRREVDGLLGLLRRERRPDQSRQMVHGLTRHSGSHQNRSKRRRLRASS